MLKIWKKEHTIQVQGWCHSLTHKLHRAGSGWHGPNYSWPGSHSSPPPTKNRCRQTDAEAGHWTQMQTHMDTHRQVIAHTHTRTYTDTHIHGHNERFQLFSAIRQCIVSSQSNISYLGEKYSLCFYSKRPCLILVRTKYCFWAPGFCIMWLTLTVASELIMRAQRVGFSYLFF